LGRNQGPTSSKEAHDVSRSRHGGEIQGINCRSALISIGKQILVEGDGLEDEKKQIQEIIASSFDEVNRLFNNWNPTSEISVLNSTPAKKKVAISHQVT
jgi:hypothetical protein